MGLQSITNETKQPQRRRRSELDYRTVRAIACLADVTMRTAKKWQRGDEEMWPSTRKRCDDAARIIMGDLL